MDDNTSDTISAEDLIRLKNKLNQDIPYGGGLNAKQVRDLEGLTKEQYAEVNRQLSEIKKSWWFFPTYFLIVGFLIGLICIFYFDKIIVQIIAAIAMIYCAEQLTYRSGLKYGYVRGYESGYEAGVHKILKISQDDLEEMRKRAVEMEIDEMIIKKMDER